ncbi:hypothetical protein IJD34_07760 [bacterium]|nr:hypothetical protein [bacterium]
MNNNISNQNFKGGFLINYKNAPKNMCAMFNEATGKNKKQIFENFNGDKNLVFYVMKHSRDYDAVDFICKNNLKFEYYPQMDTMLRFDLDKPSEVVDYISLNESQKISKFDELKQFVEKFRVKCRAKYADKPRKEDLSEKILKGLKIEIDGVKTKNNKGIITIKDEKNNGLVVISPKSKFGISYVFHKPSNKYEHERRYAVNESGELLATFNTPDGIKKFKECFNKTITP